MKYISTRGKAPALTFEDTMLTGLASDGGLYVPEVMPKMTKDEIAALRGLSYEEAAFRVMRPFVGDTFTDEEFKFSGFVASSGEPGTVITFDPDFWTSEEITEPCHRMQWGRVVGQPNPWETVEIHFSRLFK